MADTIVDLTAEAAEAENELDKYLLQAHALSNIINTEHAREFNDDIQSNAQWALTDIIHSAIEASARLHRARFASARVESQA